MSLFCKMNKYIKVFELDNWISLLFLKVEPTIKDERQPRRMMDQYKLTEGRYNHSSNNSEDLYFPHFCM